MARKLRIQFPGALYHLLSRGDRREAIVRDDVDRARFIETLSEACGKTGWKVLAFSLLSDHFHMLLTTPKPNLVEGMKWFLGTYTARFNRRHRTCGHLFSGRYKSQMIDPGFPGGVAGAADYIHLNAARAGLVVPGQPLQAFGWSSYPEYLRPAVARPVWLDTAPVFRDAGLADDVAGRNKFRDRTEERRTSGTDELWQAWRSGWCVGGEGFRKKLLEQLHEGTEPGSQAGVVWRASVEEHAEKLIARELAARGWSEAELATMLKTDPGKLAIARQIRKETTLPLTWIAARLHMGSRNTLRNALASGAGASAAASRGVFAPRKADPSGVFSKPATSPLPSSPRPAAAPTPRPAAPLPPSPEAADPGGFTVEPGWD